MDTEPRIVEDTGIYKRLEQTVSAQQAMRRMHDDPNPIPHLERAKSNAVKAMKERNITWTEPGETTFKDGVKTPRETEYPDNRRPRTRCVRSVGQPVWFGKGT